MECDISQLWNMVFHNMSQLWSLVYHKHGTCCVQRGSQEVLKARNRIQKEMSQ
jgi:hypothetical protein